MLPKIHRLPLRTDWHRVKERGRIFQSPFFGLVVCKQTAEKDTSKVKSVDTLEVEKIPTSRFAFIVSKKISKKAVVRNRAKRLLSEAVRKLLPKIKPGNEGVFLVKKEMVGKSFKEVFEETEKVLREAGILK